VNSAAVPAARMVVIYVIGAGAVKIFVYLAEILSAAGSVGTYPARGKVRSRGVSVCDVMGVLRVGVARLR